MYTIESVVRKVDGKNKIVKFIAGLGNLTNDLEVRTVNLKSGDKVSLIEGFGQDIAFDYYDKGTKKPRYFPLEVWGKSAEVLGKFGKKGTELSVVGRLEMRDKISPHGNKYEKETLILEMFQITSRSKKQEKEISNL